mgnify:CR=1 FL=1
MDTIISARHMTLTESMKFNVEHKLARIAEFYPKLNKAEVTLDTTRHGFTAEIVLHGKKINLEAKTEAENMYVAISTVAEKMEKQLRKKFRINKKHLHPINQRVEKATPTVIEDFEVMDEFYAVPAAV